MCGTTVALGFTFGIAPVGTAIRSHLAVPEPGFEVAFHVRQEEV
jgi:hypothetical protein